MKKFLSDEDSELCLTNFEMLTVSCVISCIILVVAFAAFSNSGFIRFSISCMSFTSVSVFANLFNPVRERSRYKDQIVC